MYCQLPLTLLLARKTKVTVARERRPLGAVAREDQLYFFPGTPQISTLLNVDQLARPICWAIVIQPRFSLVDIYARFFRIDAPSARAHVPPNASFSTPHTIRVKSRRKKIREKKKDENKQQPSCFCRISRKIFLISARLETSAKPCLFLTLKCSHLFIFIHLKKRDILIQTKRFPLTNQLLRPSKIYSDIFLFLLILYSSNHDR